MSKENNGESNLKKKYLYFDKLLRIFLIIGIIVISGFIIFNLSNPEPGYTTFGILNSEEEAGNYPTSVRVNENISFYLTVGNYLKRDFSFRIEILKGNNDTLLSSIIPSINSTSHLNTTEIALQHTENWISGVFNVSFSLVGTNQIIIAELWEIDKSSFEEQFINALWLKLNVTS